MMGVGMRHLGLGLLVVALAGGAWAHEPMPPPSCTVAQLAAGTCAPVRTGMRVRVTNTNTTDDSDCATTTGAVDQVCVYDGTDWVSEGMVPAGSITGTELDNTTCLSVMSGEVDPTEAGATPDFLNLMDGTGSTTEANEDLFKLGSQGMRVSQLSCLVSAAPGAGDQWDITVRAGAAGALSDTALTCSIAGAATTCTGTGSAAVAGSNHLTIGIESDGGATDPDPALLMQCAVCLSQ
jgi:hypothetical protein